MKLAERLKRFNRLRDARLKAHKVGGVVSLARQLRIEDGVSRSYIDSRCNAAIDLTSNVKFVNYVCEYRPDIAANVRAMNASQQVSALATLLSAH